jgi:hypothetical protein
MQNMHPKLQPVGMGHTYSKPDATIYFVQFALEKPLAY